MIISFGLLYCKKNRKATSTVSIDNRNILLFCFRKRKTESPQKAVAANDFFSSSKVKRVERPKAEPKLVETKPKTESKPVETKKFERNISDDVFGAMASDVSYYTL